ncbi:type II toxin-antitoxin system HicB family antitoxin [Gloeocapsa sp. PCC 73106]|uniref:type II toxin-antitoxin system HicB family antitoxin n=1 Tax=Gloeocapsa sp. PCC 73106 TaxID=102232 RepID=UPI0002ABCDDA|nr:type II toxin-antitoxin system HicB family antitoxin [Gloeocapsa sp. PCC 73106]ELR97468.1 hypothetical protein GLO73106DRAFT_00012780 [Gloeocapsa sp. PCC 73106]
MTREFNVIIERDVEGYFIASVPTLPGCHTQAKSLDELIERIQEAIVLCLEFEDNLESPYLSLSYFLKNGVMYKQGKNLERWNQKYFN